jgi:hypothetical protein
MTPDVPATPPPIAASDSVARRTLSERRWRVARSMLGVVLVTLTLLVVVLLNRDQQAAQACRRRAEFMVKAFQADADAGLRAPTELPLAPADRRFRGHYIYNWLFTNSYRPEVGVCCCRDPHIQLFQAPRRSVIVLDAETRKYRLVWMKERDFAEKADNLGLRVRIPP